MIGFLSDNVGDIATYVFYVQPAPLWGWFVGFLAVWLPLNISTLVLTSLGFTLENLMRPYHHRRDNNLFSRADPLWGPIAMAIFMFAALPLLALVVTEHLWKKFKQRNKG